jgi:hypothetical protein
LQLLKVFTKNFAFIVGPTISVKILIDLSVDQFEESFWGFNIQLTANLHAEKKYYANENQFHERFCATHKFDLCIKFKFIFKVLILQ